MTSYVTGLCNSVSVWLGERGVALEHRCQYTNGD
jgi:hypothetical protein